MVARGSKYLKIVGILMIIGGGFGLIGSIALKALWSTFIEQLQASSSSDLTILNNLGSSMDKVILFAIVVALVELVAGIVGCAFCNKPDKAMVCLVFGILLLVMAVASGIYSAVISKEIASYGSTTSVSVNPISSISSMLLPILYIIGSVLNKQSVQTTFVNQTPNFAQYNQPAPNMNMNPMNAQAAPAMNAAPQQAHQDTADSIFGVNPSLAAKQQAMQSQQARQQGVDIDARDTMDEVAIPSQADIERLIKNNK